MPSTRLTIATRAVRACIARAASVAASVVAPGVAVGVTVGVAPATARADAQMWMKGGVDRDFGDRLELGFEQHLRFDDDISRVGAFMPEVSAEYEVLPWLDVSGGYRLAYERDGNGDMAVRHRLNVDGQVSTRPEPLKLSYRLRFQEQIRDAGEFRHTIRNRVAASLRKYDPWTPEASLELFHVLGNGDGIALRKFRVTVGTEYDLGRQEVEAFYRVDIPQNDPNEPTVHILGVSIHASL